MELLPLHTEDSNDVFDVGSPRGTLQWSMMDYASGTGNTESLVQCLEDPEYVVWKQLKNVHGYNALHIAARYGHQGIVQLLLNKGFQVSNKDEHGFTALHYAVVNGHLDVAKVLLTNGAKADEPSTNGTSALQIAARIKNTPMEAILRGLDPGSEKAQGVRLWLQKIGLDEYALGFERNGYDNVEFIRQHGLNGNDLNAIGVDKLGHRKILGSLYQFPAADGEKDGDSDSESSSNDESDSDENSDESSVEDSDEESDE